MPSLLERELKRLEHVYLGENKTQIFKTKFSVSRTRGGLPRNMKSVGVEREESEQIQDGHLIETSSNNSAPDDSPLDDDEAVIKLFSVLKAPCFFKSRLRQGFCTRCIR
jgi:hypothetical protein